MKQLRIRAAATAAALLGSWSHVAAADERPAGATTQAPPRADASPKPMTEPTTGAATTTAAPYARPEGPTERDLVPRPNRPMLYTGGIAFLGAYSGSIVGAALSDRPADDHLFIPVVGPWAALGDRDCDVRPCDNEALSKTVLITSGVLQAGGLALAVASFFFPEDRQERRASRAQPSFRVVPAAVGRGGAGAFAVGTF